MRQLARRLQAVEKALAPPDLAMVVMVKSYPHDYGGVMCRDNEHLREVIREQGDRVIAILDFSDDKGP